MKTGLEHHSKAFAAGVLMGIALLLAGRSLLDLPKPEPSVPLTPTQLQVAPVLQTRTKHDSPSLDPLLHTRQLELAENLFYEGTGRNIFRFKEVTAQKKILVPPRPTPTPTPVIERVPTIALRFYGFGSKLNEPRKAFLVEGDSVFVAIEGDIVDRRYRVLKIDSNAVVIEDLIEKSVHTLRLPG